MRFRLQSSKREIKMLNRLLKVKLPYVSEDGLIERFNFIVKTINQSIPGEKFEIVYTIEGIIRTMNKIASSLNSRKILKMNIRYINDENDLIEGINWMVKLLNSTKV